MLHSWIVKSGVLPIVVRVEANVFVVIMGDTYMHLSFVAPAEVHEIKSSKVLPCSEQKYYKQETDKQECPFHEWTIFQSLGYPSNNVLRVLAIFAYTVCKSALVKPQNLRQLCKNDVEGSQVLWHCWDYSQRPLNFSCNGSISLV